MEEHVAKFKPVEPPPGLKERIIGGLEIADRRIRLRRKVLIGLFVLLVGVLVGGYFYADHAFSKRLAEELAKLEDSGEPYRLEQFVFEMPPEEENAAPLWLEAASLVPEERTGEEESAWSRFFSEEPLKDGDRTVLLALVGKSLEALAKGRSALGRPKCVFPGSHAERTDDRMLLPLRNLSRLITIRGCLQPETAGESLDLLVALAAGMEEEPGWIVQAQRAESLRFGLRIIRRWCGRGMAPADRRRILTVLAGVQPERMVRPAIVGARAEGIRIYEDLVDGDGQAVDELGLRRHLLEWWLAYPAKPWVKGSYSDFLASSRRLLAVATPPYAEALRAATALTDEMARERRDPLFRGLKIRGAEIVRLIGELAARLEIARTALSGAATTDPFDGNPIRVREEEGTRVIWSVGKDGREGTEDDIVWEVPSP